MPPAQPTSSAPSIWYPPTDFGSSPAGDVRVSCKPGCLTTESDKVEYVGSQISATEGVETVQDCQEACQQSASCQFFTYKRNRYSQEGPCALKSSLSDVRRPCQDFASLSLDDRADCNAHSYVSGPKNCPVNSYPPPRAAATIVFAPSPLPLLVVLVAVMVLVLVLPRRLPTLRTRPHLGAERAGSGGRAEHAMHPHSRCTWPAWTDCALRGCAIVGTEPAQRQDVRAVLFTQLGGGGGDAMRPCFTHQGLSRKQRSLASGCDAVLTRAPRIPQGRWRPLRGRSGVL
jgi:hypothetical protein